MIGRTKAHAVPYAVGLYISAAYWFTASTSFANPAVTLARSATDTFAGIRPDDARLHRRPTAGRRRSFGRIALVIGGALGADFD
jgi:glycerol uptake facilitator-like aquaporin